MSRDDSSNMPRRRFLQTVGLVTASLPAGLATERPDGGQFIVDCQSHLFFPEVLDLMRKRKAEPLVYDKDGTTFLRMGDWLRKVPEHYGSVEAKLLNTT